MELLPILTDLQNTPDRPLRLMSSPRRLCEVQEGVINQIIRQSVKLSSLEHGETRLCVIRQLLVLRAVFLWRKRKGEK